MDLGSVQVDNIFNLRMEVLMNEKILEMNKLLADINVLNTKIQNYHWNVKGPLFFGIHDKTEAYYNHFAGVYDELAERVIQLGGKPLVTLSQVLEMSSLAEDSNTEFEGAYVAKSIQSDFSLLKNRFEKLSALCEGDSTTAALADDQVAFFEKENWMLGAFLS